ncbi:hypothetical protein DL96DRAFT_828497 [Flagelloscypha sp. PMI_526]|nr:hypothetical protein DL96DRAFT_828497 [Flagelloscypha sp. PMI_526]
MLENMHSTYGAMLIGVIFASFLQGVLTVQLYTYFEKYWSSDSKKLKFLVTVIWLLDLAHLGLISDATYHYLISNFGNDEALLYSTNPYDLHVAFIGLATITCQAFFLKRIWVFSNKNILLTGFLAFGCIGNFTLDIIVTSQIIRVRLTALFGQFESSIIAMFASGALFDVLTAVTMLFYLRRSKTQYLDTSGVISRIIQSVIATGLLTSLVACACLAAKKLGFYCNTLFTGAMLHKCLDGIIEFTSSSSRDTGSFPTFRAANLRCVSHPVYSYPKAT